MNNIEYYERQNDRLVELEKFVRILKEKFKLKLYDDFVLIECFHNLPDEKELEFIERILNNGTKKENNI